MNLDIESASLILSAFLFAVGTAGVLVRRNAIIVFMCVELMLNAVNLTLLTAGRAMGDIDSHVFVFFSLTVAAAEVAVGLAILVSIFRLKETTDVEEINLMKW